MTHLKEDQVRNRFAVGFFLVAVVSLVFAAFVIVATGISWVPFYLSNTVLIAILVMATANVYMSVYLLARCWSGNDANQ